MFSKSFINICFQRTAQIISLPTGGVGLEKIWSAAFKQILHLTSKDDGKSRHDCNKKELRLCKLIKVQFAVKVCLWNLVHSKNH